MQTTPLFKQLQYVLPQLPNELLAQFAENMHIKEARSLTTWKKGTTLFEINQSFEHMVLIHKGLIRCFCIPEYHDNHDENGNNDYKKETSPSGDEINLRFLGDSSAALPFAAVAENWLRQTSDFVATETIQCVTDVTGFRIPLAAFEENTLFNQTVKAEIALRHYVSVEQRLRLLKTPKAADRYAIFQATLDTCIVEGMPNYHVASYLGVTPETLSRLKAGRLKSDRLKADKSKKNS